MALLEIEDDRECYAISFFVRLFAVDAETEADLIFMILGHIAFADRKEFPLVIRYA